MNIINKKINVLNNEELFYIFLGFAFFITNFRLIMFGLLKFSYYIAVTFSLPSFVFGYMGHFIYPWDKKYYILVVDKAKLYTNLLKGRIESYLFIKKNVNLEEELVKKDKSTNENKSTNESKLFNFSSGVEEKKENGSDDEKTTIKI